LPTDLGVPDRDFLLVRFGVPNTFGVATFGVPFTDFDVVNFGVPDRDFGFVTIGVPDVFGVPVTAFDFANVGVPDRDFDFVRFGVATLTLFFSAGVSLGVGFCVNFGVASLAVVGTALVGELAITF